LTFRSEISNATIYFSVFPLLCLAGFFFLDMEHGPDLLAPVSDLLVIGVSEKAAKQDFGKTATV
jgi:hypothetical protein